MKILKSYGTHVSVARASKKQVISFCRRHNIEFETEGFLFFAWAPDGYSFDGCGIFTVQWEGGQKADFWAEVLNGMKEQLTVNKQKE